MKLKHFKIEEFACPCCGSVNMDDEFLLKIDKLRELCGFPFVVTSGYRCKKHNYEIGGRDNSSHLYGLASDILIRNSRDRFTFIKNAISVGFNRIGIGSNFIHIDLDRTKPQQVIWHYYKD